MTSVYFKTICSVATTELAEEVKRNY